MDLQEAMELLAPFDLEDVVISGIRERADFLLRASQNAMTQMAALIVVQATRAELKPYAEEILAKMTIKEE